MSRSEDGWSDGAMVRREATVRASGRWRLRNWPLRTKLVVILLIPTLTALALIGLRFASETRSADRLAELSARVRTDTAIAQLVHALQHERDHTVRQVAMGRRGDRAAMRPQRERVDATLGEFSKVFVAERPNLSQATIGALNEVSGELKVLTALRGASEESYPVGTVLSSYNRLIRTLLTEREESVAEISDPELVRLQMGGTALARMKDELSVSRALIAEALQVGKLSRKRKSDLSAANYQLQTRRAEFDQFATPDQRRMYEDTVTGSIVDERARYVETVLVRSEIGEPFGELDAEKWDTYSTVTVNLAHQVEDALLAVMQEHTDRLASRARTASMRDAGIVLGLLLLAALLTLFIARSLLKPLRTLRTSALRVADYQLPAAVHGILADPRGGREARIDPVPVYSREELGQVARAFDAVHGEAVRLAVEQAALRENVYTMFVNLALRGQELYERQLSVLDRMEAEESDPEHLARLFELDHLATRGRRICENLLVLSGNQSGRMLPGSVAASDVLGAAISEIEHYQRVRLGIVPAVGVRGDVASDVVHVISELLENATAGTVHDILVTVVCAVTEVGELRVDITDNGPGMSPEAIDDANGRLKDPPVVDLDVARRMGLYVVARLAQRNGLRVRLSPAHGGGLTASVTVPSGMVGDLTAGSGQSDLAERARRQERLDAVRERPHRTQIGLSQAGPPKRAPVVNDSNRLAPRVVEPHPLDDDQPTESMPVYRELLTRWFDQNRPFDSADTEQEGVSDAGPLFDPPEPGPGPSQAPRAADGAREAAHRGDLDERLHIDPPTLRSTRSLDAAIGVNSASRGLEPEAGFTPATRGSLELVDDGSEVAGPPAAGGANQQVEANKGDLSDVSSDGSDGGENSLISRAPEAVKNRMMSLVDGVRRARQARSDEYADRGPAATVGAGASGWPEERSSSGGKEG